MARKRIEYAQNFLTDRRLVNELIQSTKISRSDVVVEIGPGEGIITKQLSEVAGKVIAIEVDPDLVIKLRSKFSEQPTVEIHEADFRSFTIREREYKIFANIPFNITSDIVKGLLTRSNPPLSAYLIMQQEAAMKFAGSPTETEFSILWKPWYDFAIERTIPRQSFVPVPSVQPVFFLILRRRIPDVSTKHRSLYLQFVRHGFEAWKKNLKSAFEDVFTYEQWKRLSHDLNFPLKPLPTELNYQQWLGLFIFLRDRVAPEKWIKLSIRK